MTRKWPGWAAIFAALAASRLCHVRILWPDGDYHLAAAMQIARGSVPYRDFWFDKPPLTPLLHVAFGARPGVPLLVGSACYLFVACVLAWVLAKKLWGEREGQLAAALLAFHLVFYLPSAVIPVPVDLAMLVPHLAAVTAAAAGMPLLAGGLAGAAFFFNVKGVFVLAVCLLWARRRWPRALAGFALVLAAGLAWLAALGALGGYVGQVWRWGLIYAGDSPEPNPLGHGLVRTANWLGFHALIALGALFYFFRDRGPWRREAWIWLAVSAAGVCLGLRFPPRYYFQLLPVLAVFGARGLSLAFQARPRLAVALAAALLLVPALRFGPRYLLLAEDLATGRPHVWKDIALDQDSHAVARIIRDRARSGETLLVWGYRPAVFAYTGLRPGSRFLDSQPLTGVPAERHFRVSAAVDPLLAAANRAELRRTAPTYIVDCLGSANPRLAIDAYTDLLPWLMQYDLIGRTPISLVFKLRESPDAAGVLAHHRLPGLARERLLEFGHVDDHPVDAIPAR